MPTDHWKNVRTYILAGKSFFYAKVYAVAFVVSFHEHKEGLFRHDALTTDIAWLGIMFAMFVLRSQDPSFAEPSRRILIPKGLHPHEVAAVIFFLYASYADYLMEPDYDNRLTDYSAVRKFTEISNKRMWKCTCTLRHDCFLRNQCAQLSW